MMLIEVTQHTSTAKLDRRFAAGLPSSGPMPTTPTKSRRRRKKPSAYGLFHVVCDHDALVGFKIKL
jgi:hypothetical protein